MYYTYSYLYIHIYIYTSLLYQQSMLDVVLLEFPTGPRRQRPGLRGRVSLGDKVCQVTWRSPESEVETVGGSKPVEP